MVIFSNTLKIKNIVFYIDYIIYLFVCLFIYFNKKVLACHPEEMWCTESHPVSVNMFDTPEKPSALVPENTSLQLDWKARSNVNLTGFWFELQKVEFCCKSLFYDLQ